MARQFVESNFLRQKMANHVAAANTTTVYKLSSEQ